MHLTELEDLADGRVSMFGRCMQHVSRGGRKQLPLTEHTDIYKL